MAEERGDPTDNTEEPTHRKLEEAQKKGQVVSSREVNHWFMILATTIIVAMFGSAMVSDVGRMLERFIALPHAIPTDAMALRDLFLGALAEIGMIVLVPMALLITAAFAASFVQHGFVLAIDLLQPKLERISLQTGASRIFSVQALAEFIKGIAKISVISAAVTALLWPELGRIERIASFEMAQVLVFTRDLVLRAMIGIVAIVSAIAAADFTLSTR